MMDVLKLKGKMVEQNINVETLADMIDMDRSTLYRKLNAFEKFTIGDARKIKVALKMTPDEASSIFLN